METKIIKIVLLGLLPPFLLGCGPDFEGQWSCKDDPNEALVITNISKNTYEVGFSKSLVGEGAAFSGEVNDDGVLVVEMMGNVSRLSVDEDNLRFSGIVAPCRDYVK